MVPTLGQLRAAQETHTARLQLEERLRLEQAERLQRERDEARALTPLPQRSFFSRRPTCLDCSRS